ncbi:MAG: bifunctional 4-hydroxy-3-methylbut-2-enyl diphosphate reductase/30S ribosomal protein S1 [Christensenellaceae bacterium]|nr:bifunctional 4-hydroxy-3-methylbut-2-enyl diphosphate reductase/30S ribosomal protein S1 [Christensenellaceae bacterium]
MPIIVADHAGFCMGVKRAIDSALSLSNTDNVINSFGELVHNPEVINKLENAGVYAVNSLKDIKGDTVLIRSHGVSPSVLKQCEEFNLKVVDLTCPFVDRLHKKVAEYSKNGLPVIIVGDKNHPEIIGTIGWCSGNVYTVNSVDEANNLPQIDEALAVAQTTFPYEDWQKITQLLKGKIKKLVLMETICTATILRQKSAREIATKANAMIVIGGKNSANTKKLYNSCKELCSNTIMVERASDIPMGFADINTDIIGITAGASTPEWSLKEVITRMTDIENKEEILTQEITAEETQVELENAAPAATAEEQAKADFLADIEATLVKIRPGQVMTGTVVQITDDEVCVNIGFKSDGLINRSELADKDVKMGDEIEVEVVKVNDGEGNVLLSQRNIVNRKVWNALVEKHENNEVVEAIAKDVVKGGIIANINGVRAFIPASQLANRYVENLDEFKGQTLKVKIIELDRQKKRIVASRKAVILEEEAAKKAEIWKTLAEGEVVDGIVRRLTNFGAFVDIGGIDGLIHITDLSWARVKHPSDVVKPDQKVQVKILSLDEERERIQLGLKQLAPRPWDVADKKYIVGSVVEGKVVRITTFGAFVELEPGLDGLVHISQCALHRIQKVEDAVQVGDIIRVKILNVDSNAHRISLSIREVLADEALDNSDLLEDDNQLFGETPEDFVEEVVEKPIVEDAVEAVEEPVAEVEEVVEDAAEVVEEKTEE